MDSTPPSTTEFVIESEQRLSDSLLWAAQRRFFERQGVAAWRNGVVPHRVTNNPSLARAYAELALGLLRDLHEAGAAFDAAAPFTIIELGAGSGRFAFYFLRALQALLPLSPFAGVPIRYVASDFTPANLAFWRSHEAFAPWLADGVLDFALFDAEGDGAFRLERAGTVLGPGSLAWAPVIIANYVFDGIAQDAFVISDGRLAECRISLRADRPDPDLDDPATIGALRCSYSTHPIDAPPYAEPRFNAILDDYAASLGDTTLLFPVSAMRCLGRLAALAGGSLLLLTADRGMQQQEDLDGRHDLAMAVHGSFSFPVNYHAMAEHVVRGGGEVLTTAYRHANIAVSAFLLGGGAFGETRLAFDQAIEARGPDDFFTLSQGLRGQSERLDFQHLLALVRLSGYDPLCLADCMSPLLERLDPGDPARHQELMRVIDRVWDNYYHLGDQPDLPFMLGWLHYGLGEFARALAFFEASRRCYGDNPAVAWNLGLCHVAQGDAAAAAALFCDARRLDPYFLPATALQLKSADAAPGS